MLVEEDLRTLLIKRGDLWILINLKKSWRGLALPASLPGAHLRCQVVLRSQEHPPEAIQKKRRREKAPEVARNLVQVAPIRKRKAVVPEADVAWCSWHLGSQLAIRIFSRYDPIWI